MASHEDTVVLHLLTWKRITYAMWVVQMTDGKTFWQKDSRCCAVCRELMSCSSICVMRDTQENLLSITAVLCEVTRMQCLEFHSRLVFLQHLVHQALLY